MLSKIKSKLIGSFLIVILVMLSVCAIFIGIHLKAKADYRQLVDNIQLEYSLIQTSTDLISAYNFICKNKDITIDAHKYLLEKDNLENIFQYLDEAIVYGESKGVYRGLKNIIKKIIQEGDSALKDIARGDIDNLSDHYNSMQKKNYYVRENVASLILKELQYVKVVLGKIEKTQKMTLMLAIGILGLLSSGCVLFSIIFSHKLTAPLNKLTCLARNISGGNLNAKLAPELLAREDEIGKLSQAIYLMVNTLEDNIAKINSSNFDLKIAKQELERYQKYLEKLVEERTVELLAAKNEAEKANELKSQFLSNISHEMRTPLNCIMGYAEILEQCSSMEEVHSFAGILLKESDILRILINDLLDNAKLKEGKMDLHYEPFCLQEVLDAVVANQTASVNKKKLGLRVMIEAEVPPYLIGDALRLRQILLNLVSNAIKFTFQGEIVIKIQHTQQKEKIHTLRFLVVDSGIGISEKDQKNIFDGFFQVDGSVTRAFGGTGLGTAIVKELVRMMGGVVGIDSKEGEGSIFWFTLDLEAAENIEEQKKEVTVMGDRKEEKATAHILVVDDYEGNQDIIKTHLNSIGCQVSVAANGKEAVEICAKEHFDLICMDIQMPVMDGYEASRLIRTGKTVNAEIPIIAVTANANTVTKEKCQQAGINEVVTKPLRKGLFLASVNKWLSLTKKD